MIQCASTYRRRVAICLICVSNDAREALVTNVYPAYEEHLRGQHFLSKDELAAQVKRYVAAFNLNCITSAQIQSTHYDLSAQRWKVRFQTPEGQRTAVSKHLVLAKGHGSQKPRNPVIADRHLYQGISIHSTQYRNAKQLREQGAKVYPPWGRPVKR